MDRIGIGLRGDQVLCQKYLMVPPSTIARKVFQVVPKFLRQYNTLYRIWNRFPQKIFNKEALKLLQPALEHLKLISFWMIFLNSCNYVVDKHDFVPVPPALISVQLPLVLVPLMLVLGTASGTKVAQPCHTPLLKFLGLSLLDFLGFCHYRTTLFIRSLPVLYSLSEQDAQLGIESVGHIGKDRNNNRSK